uniref:beta-glucosidase n=1 Tax=Oryza nivara TaxID=4536 RepID=A0A0E0FTR8_ORYNI
MYKSRLQELCQQRRWAPPEYTHRCAGLAHAPLFGATVSVNGVEFRTPEDAARSAKEAHNIAAKAAFDHLSSLPLPPPPPPSENQSSYKSQLQIYAQKKGKLLPSYQTIREGPGHASRFKSVVTVDGKAFESPEYFHTVKEAESAAAKLALMSLPQEASSSEQVPVQPLSYKNLLQELAQKHGFSLPVYSTTSDGSVQDGSFQGEPANTKKQAEMNAARVAFQHFEDRRKNALSSTVLRGPHLGQGTVHISAGQVKIAEPVFSVPQASTATSHSATGATDRDYHSLGSTNPLPIAKSTNCADVHIQPCEFKDEKPAFPEPKTVLEVMDSSPELTPLEDAYSAPVASTSTAEENYALGTLRQTRTGAGMICPKISLACVLLLLWFTSTGDAAYMKYLDPKQPTNTRIKDLISRMTLAEKIGQMTQIERGVASADVMKNYFIGSVLSGGGSVPAPQATPAVWVNMVNEFQKGALSTRLGIPMIYGIDAVHGNNNVYNATLFPHNIGLGATRHVCRDPRWGRCYESYSEDHRVVQQMTDIILGLQGDIPINHTKGVPYIAGKDKVAACAKHFVGDGGTHNGINENNTITDEHGLLGIHMPPYYDSIIKGVATVMVSYSSLNGVKMHANHDLGFVISDWLGIDRITSPPDANYTYSVQAGINAGIDMVMVPFNYTQYIDDVTSLVKKGTTILEAIKSTIADSTHVVYSENPDESFMKNNDFSFAIVVVGERTYAETTGDDPELTILDPGTDTIRTVCSTAKCAVVIISGRPVVIEPYLPMMEALVAAWLPGTEGQGVADVLFGDYGFTGKLPRTWFKSVDQLPMNVGDLRYDPLFPFGFGLTINSSQPGFSGADRLRDRNGGMVYVVLSLVLSVILMHASGIGIF